MTWNRKGALPFCQKTPLFTGGTEKKRAKRTKEIIEDLEIDRVGILEIAPETENGSIGINQIRKIKTRLNLKSAKDKTKICWVKKAQLMTTEAQNAILKTLEEPPQNVVIVLTTPNSNQLLPTIQSRCQIINLKEEVDIKLGNKEHTKAVRELQTILESTMGARLEWSYKNRGSERDYINNTLTYWLTAVRDSLISKYVPEEKVTNKNITKNSNPIMKLKEPEIIQMLENIEQAQKRLAQTNVNQQILLDNLVLGFPKQQQ